MKQGNKKYLLFLTFLLLITLLSACSYIKPDKDDSALEASMDMGEMSESIQQPPEVKLPHRFFYPGEYFVIQLSNIEAEDKVYISTPLADKTPAIFEYEGKRICIVGISYRASKGDYPCRIQIVQSNGRSYEINEMIYILNKDFEKQHLKVTEEQRTQRTVEKLKEDRVYIRNAKKYPAENKLWDGKFIQPNSGRLSTGFGVIRYINDQESGRHAGIDIAAPTGTPVKAANGGIVKYTGMLNVTGNTIIIDHGLNIFSEYAHLEKIHVKEGQAIKKGDVIGEVGSTGFSTGPHLHWTLSIGPTYIDPYLLIEKDPIELFW